MNIYIFLNDKLSLLKKTEVFNFFYFLDDMFEQDRLMCVGSSCSSWEME